jgi:hypothetical protein
MKSLLLASCLLITISFQAVAQSYSMDWYRIAGGGGTSTNGQYTLSGTIGQHDAGGPMTGGSYSLTGGFWSLISAVQTAGAPTLFISRSGTQVKVYWQTAGNWTLQQNHDLNLPAGWGTSAGVVNAGGTNSLTMNNPAGNLFFRLKQ